MAFAFGTEARLDSDERDEAADEERRRYHQNDGKRDFRDDQNAAGGVAPRELFRARRPRARG